MNESMKYLKKILTNLSLKHVLLILIFLFGLLLRMWLVFTKPLWLDEMSYYSIAASESFSDLILLNHWIKNVPPFYLIFVKLWSLFSHSKLWLRIPGLYSYIFCFVLLVSLFKEYKYTVRLLILLIYSVSVYFVFVQSWLSPYNLVILFGLLLTLLIKNYLKGSFYDRQSQFIVLVVFLHWLLINIHYSSIYFMPLYLLLIWSRKKSGVNLRVLLRLFLILLVVTLPTLLRLILNYKEVVRLSGTFVSWVDYGSFASVFFLVLRSLFRFNNTWVIFGVFLSLFSLFIYKEIVEDKTEHAVDKALFFVFFFLGLLIFYLLGMYIPSVVNERAFLIFHIGLFFLVARIISRKSIFNMIAVVSIILIFIMSVSLYNGLVGNMKVVLPGDVTFQELPDSFY